MTADEPVRSSEARAVAELALVRVVQHYGRVCANARSNATESGFHRPKN